MRDEILGPLVETEGVWSGTVVADGETIELKILLDGATPDEALASARALVRAFPETIKAVRKALVDAFLSMVNGAYRDGQPPLDEAEFLRRAKLVEVSVDSKATADFTFHDDDMLWGHWMTVTKDVNDRLDARLWG
jgi:hypothetical protein